MSSTGNIDPSKYTMPAELRLGKGKDGLVDVKGWRRELKIYSSNFFGKMALPIETGVYPDWAKPKNDKFIYSAKATIDDGKGNLVETTVKKPFPKPKDADYDEAVELRDDWKDLRKRWEDKCPQIIGFLLNGTMDAWTRKRLLQVIDSTEKSVLMEIKTDGDPLRLIDEMSKVHYYRGQQVDKDDKEKAEHLFRVFRKTPVGHGVNVTEHKNLFEEHIRKLISLGSIGNKDPRDDKFTQEDL